MIIGTVVGNIVSTKKNQKLIGCKFMKVKTETQGILVALDSIGAGIGEEVLVTQGTNAVNGLSDINIPIDAVIVGIID